MVSPGKASGGGPVLGSAVSGVLSRTNYQSLVSGADSYGYWGEQAAAPDRIQVRRRYRRPAGDRPAHRTPTWRQVRCWRAGRSDQPSGSWRLQDGQTIVMSWGLLIDSTFASPPGAWNYFVQIHADGAVTRRRCIALAGDLGRSRSRYGPEAETGFLRDSRPTRSGRALISARYLRIVGTTSS